MPSDKPISSGGKLRSRSTANQSKKSSTVSRDDGNSSGSSDTLSELNKQLTMASPGHREHLAIDNTYADTPREGTPPIKEEPNNLVPPPRDQGGEQKVHRTVIDETTVKRDKRHGAEEKKVKKRKYRFKNLSHRHQASILDMQSSKQSTFFGFYTLFWLTVAVVIVRTTVHNYVKFRQLLGTNIVNILQRDLIPIALTDLLMYLLTYFVVLLQYAIKHGYISWNRSGWIIENVWQTFYLFFFLWFADYMDFPWIGSVFLLLHSLVLTMKQHSYAFYNGYLWEILNEKQTSEKLLEKLNSKPNDKEKVEYSQEKFEKLRESASFCKEELDLQSTETPFPTNITLGNYFTYSMFPTVVYQIEYPRTESIRWTYVMEKIAAVFGVFFLMIMVAENYLYPLAMEAMKLRTVTLIERLKHYPYLLLDLTLPFILMYLLVFYIIWDAILNAIAELTRFGDREFYGQWWNSVTWDQFAKDWNTPVHRFLLRHVYHSSMSAFQVSKGTATLITFFLSSCVHELVMFSIFKKLRGYLLFLQMCQLPLIALSRLKWLRGREVLGNVIFWVGIISGPSLMCSLYLTF